MSFSAWVERLTASLKGDVNQRGLHVEPLEPRVLLSAEFGAGALDTGDDPDKLQATHDYRFGQHDQLLAKVAGSLQPAPDSLQPVPNHDDNTSLASVNLESLRYYLSDNTDSVNSNLDDLQAYFLPTNDTPSRLELIFVDGSAADYQAFVDDISADDGVEYRVFVLDGDEGGVAQISAILGEYAEVDAIHIVSHGTDGSVKLGDTWLNSDNLDEYADEFTTWASFLDADGDLLIYGCNLAINENGNILIQGLAVLTGADVAASDDLTGAEQFGADWDLEVATGQIEAVIPFSTELQENWAHVLAPPTTSGIADVTVSLGSADEVIDLLLAFSDVEDTDSDLIYTIEANTNSGLVSTTIDLAADTLTLSFDADGYGTADITVKATDSNTDTVTTTFTVTVDGDATVWFSVAGPANVTIPELTSFDSEDLIQLGGTNLGLGDTTTGTLQSIFGFTGNPDIDGVHYVTSDLTIGTANTFDVQTGDVLLSFDSSLTLSSNGAGAPGPLSVTPGDIIVVRPDVVGDYGAVNFYMLLDDVVDGVTAFTLVEEDTVIGDAFIPAGDFLISQFSTSVKQLSPENLTTPASHSIVILVDGADVSVVTADKLLLRKIDGIDIVENDLVVGGTTLKSGSLLLSVSTNSDSVFDNSLAVEEHDIFLVDVDVTSLGTDPAEGDATLFVDSSDVDLSTRPNKEEINALTIFHPLGGIPNTDPVATADAYSLNEGGSLTLTNTTTFVIANDTDADPGDTAILEAVLVSGPANASSFALNSDGSFTYVHNGSEAATDSFVYAVSDGKGGVDTETVTLTINPVDDPAKLRLSTEGDVTTGGVGGTDVWFNQQVLEFGGASLALGDTTTGTFTIGFDIENFTAAADVNAIHYVSTNLTIGTANAVNVQVGDVLLSVNNSHTLTSTDLSTLDVTEDDVFIFRPTTLGDYSAGTFIRLLEDPAGSGDDIIAVTLVEEDTVVGDTVLKAGSFLFVADGGAGVDNQIKVLTPVDLNAATIGRVQVLIDGNELNAGNEIIKNNIRGIELIENDFSIGGQSLVSGTLVISVNSNAVPLMDNGLNVNAHDVVTLDITQTTLFNGETAGTAAVFFDGSDVGLSNGDADERLDALAVESPETATTNADPVGVVDAYAVDEEGTLTVPVLTGVLNNDTDVDPDTLTAVLETGPQYASSFTLNSDGSFTYVHDGSETLSDSFVYAVSDGVGGVDYATVNITINPIDDPARLWLSTTGNVTTGGTGGADVWLDHQVLNFGGAGLGLGGTTTGTFTIGFDIGNFTATADINAIHYVTTNLTIGTANTVNVEVGDVLVSIDSSETLTSSDASTLNVTADDVFIFRPDTAGDYSAGTFIRLLEDPTGEGDDIIGISLVEEDTVVGDTVLKAGSFIFTRDSGAASERNQINVLTPGDLNAATIGTVAVLIDGNETNPVNDIIRDRINGIELIENNFDFGGVTLKSGSIILTLNNDDSTLLSDAGITSKRQDMVTLDITRTTLFNGATLGTAAIFFDGSDVGLNDGIPAEDVDALAVQSPQAATTNTDPVGVVDAYAVDEESTLTVLAASGVLANDSDAETTLTAVLETAPLHAASFTLNTDGSFTYEHDGSETLTDSFVYAASDGEGGVSYATVTITINPIDDEAKLWFSILADGAAVTGQAGGLTTFDKQEVVEFDSPGLSLGATTDGTFKSGFDIENFTADANVNAIHYVSTALPIGTGTSTVNLMVGDVLLSVDNVETLTSSDNVTTLDVTKDDVFIFRPDVVGDYSSGTFIRLLENVTGGNDDIIAITLAEEDTVVGDTVVKAGTFLYAAADVDNRIRLFIPGDLNAGNIGSNQTLINGLQGTPDIIPDGIFGLELIENEFDIGGVTLASGTILLTLDADDGALLGTAVTSQRQDIVALDITQTNLGSGSTVGTPSILFEGLQVGLDSDGVENLDALAVESPQAATTNTDPVGVVDAYAVDEEATLTVLAASGVLNNDSDFDPDTLTSVLETGPLHASSFTLNTDGSFTYVHDGSETISDSFVYAVSDGVGGVAYATVTITINPILDDGALWISTAGNVTTGGSGGTDSWLDNEVVGFDVPGLAFGEGTTAGTFDNNFNIENFTPTATNIDGLHHVMTDLTIGSSSQVDVKIGDLLISLSNAVTVTGSNAMAVAVDADDVFIFRPDVVGDYSSGIFLKLLTDLNADDANVTAFTLVEEDTILTGTRTLLAGDFLYAVDSEEIILLDPADLGAADIGTRTILVDGAAGAARLNAPIDGLELIEFDQTVGGTLLSAGDLLVSLDSGITVMGSQVTESQDVFILDLTATTFDDGDIAGTATIFLDGSDVGLDPGTGGENVDAVSLQSEQVNHAPTATNLTSASAYTEGDATVALTDIVVSDIDTVPAQTITATLTLADNNAGVLTTSGSATYASGTGIWTITDTVANVNAALAAVSFNPSAEYDQNTNITTHIEDQNAAGPVDGLISLNVTPVNDAPTASNMTSTSAYTEDDATVAIADIVVKEIDSDPAQTITATLTLANINAGLLTTSGSATYNPSTGVWTISDTVANVNAALAALSFTPAAEFALDTLITTHIEDQNAVGPADGTISLNVTPVNDAPDAIDDTTALNGAEETQSATLNATLLGNDTDVEGDTLSITEINGTTLIGGVQSIAVTNGTVDVDASDNITFTPALDHTGAVSFTYTVDDGNGGTDTATVSGTITNVNDAPTAVDDTTALNGAEETQSATLNATLLGNDTDVEGDTLSITAINGTTLIGGVQSIAVTNGTVDVDASDNITFTPALDHTGAVSFTYTVDDGNGGTDTATVSGTITNVNDAPTAVDDTTALNGAEETQSATLNATLLGNDTDVEGDTLSITAINGTTLIGGVQSIAVTNGTVDVDASDNITFTPALDHTGAVSFTYTVDDGNGGTDTATVSGTITNVNDAPTAVDDTTALNGAEETQSATLNATLLGNDTDVEGDTLSITAINGTTLIGGVQSIAVTNGTVDVDASDNITFTPALDHIGAVSFTYTVDDGNGGTDTATVSGTITNVNDAPTAVDDTTALNGAEETQSATLNATLLGNDTDVEGDTLSITAINGTPLTGGVQSIAVTNGTVDVDASDNITFTPALDHTGAVSFTYTVDDGNGGTDTATVSGTITNVNDAPTAVDDTTALNGAEETQSATLNATLLGNDTDVEGDTLSITAINGTTLIGGVQSIAVTNGTVDVDASDNITFTPALDHTGAVSFTYTVDDGNGGTDTATVSGTITNVNDAPTAVDDTTALNGAEETQSATLNATLLGNDTDVEGDTLSITEINGTTLIGGVQSIAVTNGTVDVDASDNITFTPALDHTGAVSFTYTVDDGNGGTDTATVSGTITNVNDAPTAVDDTTALNGAEETQSATLNATLLGNDTDVEGDTLSITAINGTTLIGGVQSIAVTNGTVDVDASDNITFTPALDHTGAVSFTYTVDDGNGGTDTATVSGTITNVNDAPTAVDDTTALNGAEETQSATLNATLLGNDTDVEGDTLSITAINGTPLTGGVQSIAVTNGTVDVDASDNITFTPALDHTGAVSFTYTVDDGNGGTDTATVSGTITNVNDAPTATNLTSTSAYTEGDTPVAITDIVVSDVDTNPVQAITATLVLSDTNAGILTTSGSATYSGLTGIWTITDTITNVNAALAAVSFAPANNYALLVTITTHIEDQDAAGPADGLITLNVTPVNDPPTTSANTVTTPEDTDFTFTAADFAFNDPDIFDVLASIEITTLETSGALQLNGVDVTLNQVITKADIDAGKLKFVPVTDENGTGYDSFNFTVNDGTVDSTSSATMTIDVTAVADAPTLSNQTVSTIEDTTHTFNASDFNFADADGDALASVRITVLETAGTLQLNGVDVTLNQVINRADIDAGKLKFIPAANASGVGYDSFGFSVNDGGLDSTSSATVTIDVTAANDAPTTNNATVVTNEDTDHTFVAADFNFSDIDGDTLASIKVTALETVGALKLSGADVTLNQVITSADIVAGNLTFTPVTDANGLSYDSFSFTVNDGTIDSTGSATVTVAVTAVNDAPVVAASTVTMNEDAVHTFVTSDFVISDVDAGATLASIKITSLETAGVLQLNGVNVTLNQVVTKADIDAGLLRFTPAANANGLGYASFAFSANDGTSDSISSATVTMDVTAANDAPTTLNGAVVTLEDTTYTFALGDFAYSDVDGDPVSSIRVTTLETSGSLQLNGIDVTLNQVIAAADITGGKLKFIPAADANGIGYDSFAFAVSDGALESAPAAMTINVTPVNDAPTALDNTVTATEDLSFTFTSADFPIVDLDGDPVLSIEVTGLASEGALEFNGAAVTLNQVISKADLDAGKLKFIPAANGYGPGYDTFKYTVSDGLADSNEATLTLDVNAVNDLPTTSNQLIGINEDQTHIFSAADFNFVDVDPDTLASVQITSLESAGTLRLNGVDVTLNQVITRADIDAGLLRFAPQPNATGVGYDSFDFTVNDGTGDSVASATLTFDVSAVNDPPTSSSNTVVTNEDASYVFAAADFNYSDLEGAPLTSVQITSLETAGTLQLNGVDVTLNQVVSKADIDAGKLVFIPTPDANGAPFASFEYTVNDGNADSIIASTMTVDVNPLPDAPTTSDRTVTTSENIPVIFSASQFLFADVDAGASLASIKVTGLETIGNLQLNGVDVVLNQVISRADIDAGLLRFTPLTNDNGIGYDSFDFTVNDGGLDSAVGATITIDVGPVNSAPATADKTVTLAEDVTHTFAAADFSFSDPDVGDVLSSVEITSLETAGALQLSGVDVVLNQIISRADIDAGNLKFVPAPDAAGVGYDSFGFTVSDGFLSSASPATMTVDVTASNDAPTAMNMSSTSAYTEGAGSVAITDIVVTEVDVTPVQMITATLTLADTNAGVLTTSGSATYTAATGIWTITDSLSNVNAALAAVSFTPLTNYDLDTTISTHIEDQDGLGPVDGLITLDVTPVNDAPTATNMNSVSAYTEGDASVSINDILVTDVDTDPAQMITATLTLANTAGGVLTTSGTASYAPATGIWTMTDTVANVNAALAAVSFTPAATFDQDTVVTTHIEDQSGAGPADGTITLDVTPVGSAPATANNTVTTLEDVSYTFVAADFSFADADSGDVLTAIRITSLPANGSVQLNGVDVSLNQVITKTDLDAGKLKFVPVADANGAGYDSFGFRVSDGVLESAPAVMTIDVTAVADAPVVANSVVSTIEDTVLTLAMTDFNIADADAGSTVASIRVTGLESVGDLELNGVDVVLNQVITSADIDAGLLRFTPAANGSGLAYDSLSFTANDGALDSTTSATVTIDVTSVNDAPTTSNGTVLTNEDTVYTFTAADFAYVDLEGVALASIKIISLETAGALQLSGVDITLNQVVTRADIDAGNLTFVPSANSSGTPFASFGFKVSDGVNESISGATQFIDVAPVNDAPVVTDSTLVTPEDTTITLAVSDFNISDVDAGATLASIKITSLETAGTLQLNGVDVVLNQVILKADIDSGLLKFTPQANANGPGYSSFGFTANDGALDATTSATVTIDVSAVNDAPVTANSLVTTDEDVDYTFTVADFGYTDVESAPLASIKVTSLETSGDLKLNGVDVLLNQVVTATDIASGKLKFTPAPDANGIAYDSFGFLANDGVADSVVPSTMSIDVTPVNDSPTALDKTVTVLEDTTFTFASSDFPSTDPDGDPVVSITVTSLEANGTLQLSGVDVALNQVISVADLDAGKLKFIPVADAYGPGYDTLKFTVSDGLADSNEATLTIDVTAVNDAPTSANGLVTLIEDSTYTFTAADFNFSDVDPDNLASIKIISLESAGTLQLNGVDVTLNEVVTRAQIDAGLLRFTPQANASGAGYDTFQFTVNDGTADAVVGSTLTVDVTALNDAPTTSNNTVVVNEDAAYKFVAADFNFVDIDGDPLDAITITALESAGALQLNGIDVTLNQTVSKADIDAGKLEFVPAADANGLAYASFSFTASDGLLESTTASTMTVDVTPVADAPTSSDQTRATPENTALIFAAGDFGFADVDVGDSLSSIKVVSLESVGTLTLNGVDVTLNQVISRVDIDAGLLRFTPAVNDSGVAYDSFGFTVNDGTSDSALPATMTIDVGLINSPPTTASNLVILPEDTSHVFSVTEFNFSDIDAGDVLVSIQITGLESTGSLKLGGVDVVLNQIVPIAAIAAGDLVFTPGIDANGIGYDSFTFTVNDGLVDSTSSATISFDVTPVNDPPTGTVGLTGLAQEDETLTADTSGIGDVDGLTTFTYQWQRDGVDIVGATGPGYVPGDDDVDSVLTVTVAYTDDAGSDEVLSSNPSGPIANVNDLPVGDVLISGLIEEDQTVSADTSGLLDDDGLGTFSYQWLVNGIEIAGANSVTYTLGDDDVDQVISVVVSYEDGHGTDEKVTSANSSAVLNINDSPTTTGLASLTVNEDSPDSIVLLTSAFSDLDNETLTFSVAGVSDSSIFAGIAINNAGELRLSYAPNASGLSTISITAVDGSGGTATASFTVTVLAVNDAPQALIDAIGVSEDTAVNVPATAGVLANDLDVDPGDSLSVLQITNGAQTVNPGEAIRGDQGGIFRVAADGSFTFDPGGDFQFLSSGDVIETEVLYVVVDSQGATTTIPLRVAVFGANDEIVANGESTSVSAADRQTATAETGLLANDSDIDQNDSLSVIAIGNGSESVGPGETIQGSGGGNFTVQADGSYIFEPGSDFVGLTLGEEVTTTISYSVSDGRGDIQEVTLSIVVAGIGSPVGALGETVSPSPSGTAPDTATPVTSVVSEPESSSSSSDASSEGDSEDSAGDGENDQTADEAGSEQSENSNVEVSIVDFDVDPDDEDQLPGDIGIATAAQTLSSTFSEAVEIDIDPTGVTAALSLSFTGSLGLIGTTDSLLLIGSPDYNRTLDDSQQLMQKNQEAIENVRGGTITVSVGISIAYVAWLIRSGVVMGSVLSAIPAWRLVDPLPILSSLTGGGGDFGDAGESIEEIVQSSNMEDSSSQSEADLNQETIEVDGLKGAEDVPR